MSLAWNSWVECAGLGQNQHRGDTFAHHIPEGCALSVLPVQMLGVDLVLLMPSMVHDFIDLHRSSQHPASGHFLSHSFINFTNELNFKYFFFYGKYVLCFTEVHFSDSSFWATSWLSQLWLETFWDPFQPQPSYDPNILSIPFIFFSHSSLFRLFMGRGTKFVYSNQQSFNKITISGFFLYNFPVPPILIHGTKRN